MAKLNQDSISKNVSMVAFLRFEDREYDSSNLVAISSSEFKTISQDEIDRLSRYFSQGIYENSKTYCLVEVIEEADIRLLIERGKDAVEKERKAEEARRIAYVKRREKTELDRKRKRLAKLEGLASKK